MVNYFTNPVPNWGWRVSLGAAAVPALVIVVGSLLVPDTPTSLMLRGADADVEAEFKEIVAAVEHEEGVPAVRGDHAAFFDLTGFIVIFIFAPVLFRTVGFASDKALLGSVAINMVGLFAVVVSTFVVDRCGRRVLFVAGGISMLLCQVAVAWILGEHLGETEAMAREYAAGVVALMCVYTWNLGVGCRGARSSGSMLNLRSKSQAIDGELQPKVDDKFGFKCCPRLCPCWSHQGCCIHAILEDCSGTNGYLLVRMHDNQRNITSFEFACINRAKFRALLKKILLWFCG